MQLLDDGMLVLQFLVVDIAIGSTLDALFAITIGVLLKILINDDVILLVVKWVAQLSYCLLVL